MTSELHLIVDILEKEYNLYREMLELSEKKMDLIRKGHVTELEKLVKLEQTILLLIGRLEKEREMMIEDIAVRHKIPPLTLTDVEALADDQLKERITRIRSNFEKVMCRQRDYNRINEQLIKNNLEYIDYFLDLYIGENGSGALYAKDGHTPFKQQKLNLFDKKA